MWLHFFKNHSAKFFLVIGSMLGLYALVTAYVFPSLGHFDDEGEVTYYAGIFTFLLLGAIFIKGFNNKMLLLMCVVTTIVEIEITNYILSFGYDIYWYTATFIVPSFATLVIYRYYNIVLLKAGEWAMRFARFIPVLSLDKLFRFIPVLNKYQFNVQLDLQTPTYTAGRYLLVNVSDTNLYKSIFRILKVFFCFYVALVTYLYCFFDLYNLPAEGFLSWNIGMQQIWVWLNLPDALVWVDTLFLCQTYMILGFIIRAAVQEHYVKDLTGAVPLSVRRQFRGV